MTRWMWPAAALALAPALAGGQTVRGTVHDDASRAPIMGAMIELVEGNRAVVTARSDSVGAFLLYPRRPGSFTVRVNHPAYVAVTAPALELKAGETIELELVMGRTAIPLEPVVVTARSRSRLDAFHERSQRAGGFGQFLTRQDIERRAGATRATDLLRGLSGVEIVSVSRGGSDQDPVSRPGAGNEFMPRVQLITMRSGNVHCEPAIFIDGMRIRQMIDAGIDEVLRPEMIEGVEIYTRTAGAPAELIEPGTCGAVAFWSKEARSGVKWSWLKFVGAAAGFALMVTVTR